MTKPRSRKPTEEKHHTHNDGTRSNCRLDSIACSFRQFGRPGHLGLPLHVPDPSLASCKTHPSAVIIPAQSCSVQMWTRRTTSFSFPTTPRHSLGAQTQLLNPSGISKGLLAAVVLPPLVVPNIRRHRPSDDIVWCKRLSRSVRISFRRTLPGFQI